MTKKIEIDMTQDDIRIAVEAHKMVVHVFLLKMRAHAKLSQLELANKMNEMIGKDFVALEIDQWEKGKREIPGSTLLVFSRACGFVYKIGFVTREKWTGHWDILKDD